MRNDMKRSPDTDVGKNGAIVRICTDGKCLIYYVMDCETLTLERCREIAVEMGWSAANDAPITVIAEEELTGAVYKYGNHHEDGKAIWEKVGETVGYA